jgi:hypothetical protein
VHRSSLWRCDRQRRARRAARRHHAPQQKVFDPDPEQFENGGTPINEDFFRKHVAGRQIALICLDEANDSTNFKRPIRPSPVEEGRV